MTEERKQAIQITLAYTCIMVAVAFGAFAFSLWLVISGRLFRDGVDGVFLFAVGLVLGSVFSSVPAISIRQGLLSDVSELWREGTKHAVTRQNQISPSVRVQTFQAH
ncbi:MAG TPA: hypothetical protein VF251_04265 [Pyrinomonadaceae bacterium]|jgi:hypothetical protein